MLIYFVPFISAIAGWLIMQLLLNLYITPVRMKQIVQDISSSMLSNIAMPGSIIDRMKDPEKFAVLKPAIEEHLDTFLQAKLFEKLPYLAGLVGDSTIKKIKDAITEEIENLFPILISKYADTIAKDLNFQQIITERLDMLDSSIWNNALKKEFKKLYTAGAIIGFACGILSAILLLL